MEKLWMIIRKELVIKLDFVNLTFELGWIWVILTIIDLVSRLILFIIKY